MIPSKATRLLAVIGPGMMVAATGVGAGDLATAALTGSALGLTVLWAVLLGAFLKFVMNEGLARWQLATGRTLLEGCADRLGRPACWLFLAYLLVWSFLVAAALTSAIGVTSHAIYPLFGATAVQTNKIVYGILHSLLALLLVKIGGYRLFEKVMSLCVGVMFLVVIATAVALQPAWTTVARGLFWPAIPADGVSWTVALMGGVGGTVTVLCYGYWIREEGRQGVDDLKACRLDLATAYVMTAVFGLAMVIIGGSLGAVPGRGANLIVAIAGQLEAALGTAGPYFKWAFLVGAWAAVFSSLLGVWQSVPYLFADLWRLMARDAEAAPTANTKSLPYQVYLFGIATIPLLGLIAVGFPTMQKTYAVVGALFVPMLAVALLLLNGRAAWVGRSYKNSTATSLVLIGTLLFFLFVGALELRTRLFGKPPVATQRMDDTAGAMTGRR